MESIEDRLDSWQLWCRVCAKSDTKDMVNIFVKNERQTDDDTEMMETNDDINKKILNAIEQYFPAKMENCDALPKMLCSNCYNLMKALCNFSEYVKRVQQMFNAIQQSTSETAAELSLKEIRRIYGITDIYNEHVLVKLPLAEANYIETEPIINATNEDTSFVNMDTNNPLELFETNFNIKEEEISPRSPPASKQLIDSNDNYSNDKKISKSFLGNDLKKKKKACKKKPNKAKETKKSRSPPASKQLTDSEDNYSNDSDEQWQEDDANDDQSAKGDEKITKSLLGKDLNKKKGCKKKPIKAKETLNKPCSPPASKQLTDSEDNCSNDSDEQWQEDDANDDQSLKVDEKITKSLLGKDLKKKGCKKKPIKARETLNCSECPRKFKSKLDYENHMKFVHSKQPIYKHACKQCPRTFYTEYLLKQHLKTHVMCEKCGKMLKTQISLEKHMLSHSASTSLKCHICEEVFDYRYNLERHMKIQHSFKPSCKVCGLKVSSNQYLTQHMRIHNDEKRHKCDYCGSAFKQGNYLRVHLLLHAGLKPFSCDFCEFTFTSGSNCRKHEKTTHAKEFSALVASGGVKKKYPSQDIPNLATLKAILKTADNIKAVPTRQSAPCGDKPENVAAASEYTEYDKF